MSFNKNLGRNIGKSISKNLSGKYISSMLATRQKLLDHAKQSATDSIKTVSKRAFQKTAGAIGGLIVNKISNAVARSCDGTITKVSRNSLQINSETVTNKHDKEIPKERYISPEERQKILDDLRLI